MRSISTYIVLALLVHGLLGCATDDSISQAERQASEVDLEARFAEFSGGFLLRSLDDGTEVAIRPETMIAATAPCSTFKVPHALMALEEGLLEDRSATIIRWDGEPKSQPAWERDHDLGSAMQNSVLWYFQEIARRMGMAREKSWLERLHYGNADPSSGLETFWLGDGSLQVTPADQLAFWSALLRRELPASRETQEETLDLVTIDRRGADRLFGKTGSGGGSDPEQDLGWFVGGIERDGKRQIFVTRIRGAGAWGPEARKITLALLADLDLWPVRVPH